MQALKRHMGTTTPLTREEEVNVFALVQGGDERAVDIVVRANLRFVVQVAHEYWRPRCPLPWDDLISEGCVGLLRAIRMFDAGRGYKFLTYAVHFIRKAMLIALARERTVRLPLDATRDARVWRQACARTEQERSRTLTDSEEREVAREMGLDPVRQIYVRMAASAELSLDSANLPYEPDLEAQRGRRYLSQRWLMDKEAFDAVDRAAEEGEVLGDLRGGLSALDGRLRLILRMYYTDGYSLENIGERLGLTRERVRRLREVALAKLRKHAGLKRHEKDLRSPSEVCSGAAG